MAIRWDKKYTRQVQRIVSNFNKRLEYQESYGAQYLPEKTSMAYIRDVFTSRRDLNRYLRQLERFNAKSAQVVKVGYENKKMTKWEKETLIQNRASARAKIKKAMAQTRARQGAKLRDFERGESYLTMKSELKRLGRSLSKMSARQIESNERIANKYREMAKRNRLFKKNFKEMLLKDSIQAKTNPEQTGRIMDMIEQLTPDELIDLYNDNPNIRYIVEHYHLYTAEDHDAVFDVSGKKLIKDELNIIEGILEDKIGMKNAIERDLQAFDVLKALFS